MIKGMKMATNGVNEDFSRLALKNVPHHLLLTTACRLKIKPLVWLIDRQKKHQLRRAKIQEYSLKEVDEYCRNTKETKLWHGTGRYQYDSNGKVVDILRLIIEKGGLMPLRDVYAIFVDGKAMTSISATPLRMIARSYADTHGLAKNEFSRYGDSHWWVAYYYGQFYAELLLLHGKKARRNWRLWKQQAVNNKGEIKWGKKVNRQARKVWDTFTLGSDIDGNYPILVGIKKPSKLAKMPKLFARAEVRLVEMIAIDDLSHLEVPGQYLDETRDLLEKHGCNLAVLPLELGEFVASRQDFHVLLGMRE